MHDLVRPQCTRASEGSALRMLASEAGHVNLGRSLSMITHAVRGTPLGRFRQWLMMQRTSGHNKCINHVGHDMNDRSDKVVEKPTFARK